MDLLIHATLIVTGDREQLPACDARIKTLLVEEVFTGTFEEHHGDAALSYDFKVSGGIPFPAFAAASQEFPQLEIAAEWVNVAAGRKGRARLAGGKITEHVEEALALGGTEPRNRYVLADADGTLRLAMAMLQTDRNVWAGYVLNHERDALFRITREDQAVTLQATTGAPEWAQAWRLGGAEDAPPADALEPPQAIEAALYGELERLARDFVAAWIWFRDNPQEEIAIDLDRYARYGYTPRAANVRAARLHKMGSEAAAGSPLEYSTLDAEHDWVRGVLLRCWAGTDGR